MSIDTHLPSFARVSPEVRAQTEQWSLIDALLAGTSGMREAGQAPDLRAAEATQPEALSTRLARAELELGRGRPEGAREVLEDAAKVPSARSAELYYQLALVYRIKGEDANAATALAHCLASQPDAQLKQHAEALAAQLNVSDRRGTGRGILRRSSGGR